MLHNFCFDTSLLRSEGPPILKNFQQIHPVIQDDNWSQLWLPFNNLNIWIVTLETSIIRIITFSRIESYLTNSNDAILCQWHYNISNFKFLAPTQLLPPQLQLTEIWEMLAISNYANPQLVISTWNANSSLIYPPPLAIRILGQDFPDLSPNSNDII